MGALTVQKITDRVRRQFGDTGGALITDQAMYDWINDAMREIILENNLLKIRATSLTVANQSNYGLPSDLLRFDHISYAGEALPSISVQEASNTVEDMDDSANFPRGIPQTYWVYGNELFLYPAPTAASVTITIYYNRNPVEITTMAGIPELPARYDNRLVEYCLAQAAEIDDDTVKSQSKLQQFKDGLEKARDEEEGPTDIYQHMGISMADSAGYSLQGDY